MPDVDRDASFIVDENDRALPPVFESPREVRCNARDRCQRHHLRVRQPFAVVSHPNLLPIESEESAIDHDPHIKSADEMNQEARNMTRFLLNHFGTSNMYYPNPKLDHVLTALEEEEGFEVVQMVKNILEINTDPTETVREKGSSVVNDFIVRSAQDLDQLIRHDRLSLVEINSKKWKDRGLSNAYISPRATIPKELRLELVLVGDPEKSLFTVRVLVRLPEDDRWKRIDLKELVNIVNTGIVQASDSVLYAERGLGCAVIALEGERCLYQTESIGREGSAFKLRFHPIAADGNIMHPDDVAESGLSFDPRLCRILAVSTNSRQMKLRQYIKDNVLKQGEEFKMIEPLKHLIGAADSKPLVTSMLVTVDDSYRDLNEFQKKVAHPLYLRTANEVAGPPGTGKTQVITELSKALLRCTDKNVVVLSERNAAIDAVAEKFARECYSMDGGRIVGLKNMDLWRNVVLFGSPNSMGQYTKMFTLEEKIRWHPEMIAATHEFEKCQQKVDECAYLMRNVIAIQVENFGDEIDDDRAFLSGERIRKNASDLSNPAAMFKEVRRCVHTIHNMLKGDFDEVSIRELDDSYAAIISGLFPIPSNTAVGFGEDSQLPEWNKEMITNRLKLLLKRFMIVLKRNPLDVSAVRNLERARNIAAKDFKSLKKTLMMRLDEEARFRMSTIGSSGQLFESDDEDYQASTVAIFDEAGCIPSFELLGLGLLNCSVDSIVVVGDKHQLPPYDPSSMGNPQQDSEDDGKKKLRSMLDVSVVDPIKLRLQYRVPEVIASILNERIYNGDYETASRKDFAGTGLYFEDIIRNDDDSSNSSEQAGDRQNRRTRGQAWRKSYVNKAEIERVFELIRLKNSQAIGGKADIIVLSPYKEQQREIQRQIKLGENTDLNLDSDCILTIDQCQGQEADIVLFSLVKKPTIFLDRFRMNVALSRFKKQLYIIGDRIDFQLASLGSSWECAPIAREILDATTERQMPEESTNF